MGAIARYLIIVIGCIWIVGCASDSSASANKEIGQDDASDTESEWGFTPFDFFQQCTDSVCDFDMFEGEDMVRGIGTWHPGDTGFSLIGDPVVISVFDNFAGHPEVPVRCYTVSVMGNWEDDVRLFLEVSGEYGIFGKTMEESLSDTPPVSDMEGEFLFRRRIVNGNWKPFELSVRTLKHRGLLDFSIRKEGAGDVVFYFIEVDGQIACPADAVEVD